MSDYFFDDCEMFEAARKLICDHIETTDCHHFNDRQYVVCLITLSNGVDSLGVCDYKNSSEASFDYNSENGKEQAEDIAFENAISNVLDLMREDIAQCKHNWISMFLKTKQ